MKTLFLVAASIVVAQSFSSVPSCSFDEAKLTGKRVQTLIELGEGLSINKTSTTFNLDWFLSQLAPLFTPDISFDIPLGVGHFVGLKDAAEYLASTSGLSPHPSPPPNLILTSPRAILASLPCV